MGVTVQAFMDTHLVLPKAGIPPSAVMALRDAFTHDNEQWHALKRMGKWTGPTKKNPQGIPRKLFSYREDGPFMLLPRGSRDKVGEVLSRHGLSLEVEDRTLRLELIKYGLKGKLRPYQEEAVENMVVRAHPGCALKGPCGSGKTVTMLGVVVEVGQPTLVVVHTKPLMTQWLTAVEQWLGLTPGTVGGGRPTVPRTVTVGMQQKLWRIVKEGGPVARDLRRSFGCLVIDEMHHAPAASFMLVSEHFPAAYRVGCSATIQRKDGREYLLEETFGPVAHEVLDKDLVAAGKKLPLRMEVVPTNFVCQEYLDAVAAREVAPWQRMVAELVADDDRNALVWKHLRRVLRRRGTRILLLNDRVRACKDWTIFLRGEGVPVGLMIGGAGNKDEQARTIRELRNGKLQVGVGTKIADEGLDLPELTHVFVTCPVHRNPSRLEQMVGRASRPAKGKKVGVAVYFWDREMWASALPTLRRVVDELEIIE